MSPLIVIPARMASTRLPGKPLADLNGAPMIVRVCQVADASGVGRVAVAAAEPEIVQVVREAGYEAVLTDPDLPSGSDRVHAALLHLDPDSHHDTVVNLQGDMPTLPPRCLRDVIAPLCPTGAADIATLVCRIEDEAERVDPNVVKAVMSLPPGARSGRALYFTRATAPWGDGPLYHHVGVYAYRRAALDRFVRAPQTALETRERLEQLRALELGLRIDAVEIPGPPPNGVDTPADLAAARRILALTP